MIKILDNKLCCGCNACGDICGKQAISFVTDDEGFWYPKVDEERCVECGLCEKVCPIINKVDSIKRFAEPVVYAAYSKNEEIRLDSTSGGIHSMLAGEMYKRNAFVSGAIYKDDHTVTHIVSNDPAKLDEIRSSKYLQSSMDGQYKEVRNLLREGKEVFYCACPCQIQALYKFLQKDYPNLTTCDFICKGVNSPKVFLKYIDMLERQYGARAISIKFKSKKWGWHNFSTRIIFANGKEYCKDRYHDSFFIGYLQSGNFSRPSCYECHFKGIPQMGDITLADFWGIENIDKSMDQDKGTSLVMVNSEKGLSLFNSIQDLIICKQFSLEQAVAENQALLHSAKALKDDRSDFFSDLDRFPFEQITKKYFPQPSLIWELKRIYGKIRKMFI